MNKVERVTSVKNELLNIFMGINVAEHEKHSRRAAQRNLRARRGIELHREFKQLEQEIADLVDAEIH